MTHRCAPPGTLTHDPLDARQFEIAVRRLANALTYGQESSPFLGAGIEYVQSRLYQSGDPVKFIDWRITGRTGRFHVKEYEAPKQMPVYLLVDTSASMCVSSQRMSKYAWAVQTRRRHRAGRRGAHESGGPDDRGRARPAPHAVACPADRILQWLHQLRHYQFTEGTTLGKRVRELIPRVEQRCLFVVISDLHDPDAIPAIKLMAHDHDCAVLHLEDPAERGGLRGGIFRAVEAETGPRIRGPRPQPLSNRRGHPHAWPAPGWITCILATDEPIVPRLRHFLKNRKSTRRTG